MPLIGLIGYPLSHSFSPEYFNAKFEKLGFRDWKYILLPIKDIGELPEILEANPELVAFNVTIPHKKAVISFCDSIDQGVKEIGACNLVIIVKKESQFSLKAFNTDLTGFLRSLPERYKKPGTKALVMGTGGSSLAVIQGLKSLDISFTNIGRNTNPSYESIDLSEFDIIVNCTPIGMTPIEIHGEKLPMDYSKIKKESFYFDLVYNPHETAMMRIFKEKNCDVQGGLEMLHQQAEAAWDIIWSHHA